MALGQHAMVTGCSVTLPMLADIEGRFNVLQDSGWLELESNCVPQ